jgi:enediyne biosynthesis protein E4
MKSILTISILMLIAASCAEEKKSDTLFSKMEPAHTNIHFSNKLAYEKDFNIYTYRNFYNGGGVAIGDINKDGLPDIFFTANMQPNKLYLNKGNFVFEDITEKAGIGKKGKWSTGVSMADVNGDGWLDIYVCNSGDVKGDHRENELYINNGNGSFTEKAQQYGLDERGLSTHAAFFDYDKDSDLDMFLLNNSFKAIGSFNLKENERNKRDSVGGHKFYRNDGDHFTDISEQAGIFGSVIGFGLGVTVGDVDADGWQDIYVSNDFFERDYLYINKHDGSFRECLEEQMMSISNASMGADMADINNDGRPDIFVTEMLPGEDARIKTNITYENWNKYQLNLKYDYYHQFTRNMLQLNNGDNTFSEVGRFAGVCATDWSWGALITDLDNDGFKDIFVANGIYQDLINQDYVHYISNEQFFKTIVSGKADYRKLIDLIPSNALPNYAFHNNGNITFTNLAKDWGLDEPSFSNGSAYGDLDNDGDLDLVINNLNMPCFVYRNEARQKHPENKFISIELEGSGKNTFGVGALVTVFYNNTLATQEQMPMRGFESTVDTKLVFGLGKTNKIDSIVTKWPDGHRSVLRDVQPGQTLTIKQSEGNIPGEASDTAKNIFSKSIANFGLGFKHRENVFSDFDHDPSFFHMLSTQGPHIARGDINKDGLEDIYIGGAKDQPGALYMQTAAGLFKKTNESLFASDSASEDTDAIFFDADSDGDQDLYVCSGGNEFSANSSALIDRLYINDGKGKFTKSPQVLPSFIFESTSCVSAADYDADGDQDLFVGVRLKPLQYGNPCKGYVLQNNGKGTFTDVTSAVAPALISTGMIADAEWFDYDNDKRVDLVLTGEYMPIKILHNEGGKLKEVTEAAGLAATNGWWNRIVISDVNNDGFPDIIAGNHGLNSRFTASAKKPVTLYAADFDENGKSEQILTCYNKDTAYPMILRHDLVGLLPYLKKKYLKYESFKNQTIENIFTPEQLQNAVKLQAFTMESCVFINNKNGAFQCVPLPAAAQFSPVYGILADDIDHDGNIDLVIGGNFYESKPEAGIYDASYGLLLTGNGKGQFKAIHSKRSGIRTRGAVRDIINIKTGKKNTLIIARNNDVAELYNY